MEQVKLPKFKDYTDQKVNFFQRKLDGHLTKIHIDGSRIRVYSKNDKDITEKLLKVTHIREELMGLPSNSLVFGELHCPDVLASSIPTLLNNADEKLMFTAFAAPLINGEDWSDERLDVVMLKLKSFGLNVSAAYLVPTPTKIVPQEGKEALLEIAVEKKWEGWVLKEEHMKGWYKLKPVKTIDAFVTGTCISTSDSFGGGLKRIRIGIWELSPNYPTLPKIHDLGNTGNGFKKPYRMQFMSAKRIAEARTEALEAAKLKSKELSDEELAVFDLPRLEMNSLLNKVCEIAYDSITAGKKLRFPRFIRWRDDKDIKDCTTEQLEE